MALSGEEDSDSQGTNDDTDAEEKSSLEMTGSIIFKFQISWQPLAFTLF